MKRAATVALVLAACGPSAAGPRGPSPRPEAADEREPAPRAERTPGRPYAETPITAVADELTELALALAEGRPAPATGVPLRSPLAAATQARFHTDAPAGPTMVIGIAFELELLLKRGEPDDDAEPSARWGSLRLTLALSRNGLRLYSLRPRTMSRALPSGPLPVGMEGFAAVAGELLAALRAGDVSAYALDEADRALLGNDEAWIQVQQDRVAPELVADVRAMLATLPDAPLAYRLDDVAILVAAPEARLLSYAMSFEPEGDRFVLATEPLVEVRQLWPR